MQAVHVFQDYPDDIRGQIECMSPLAQRIAARWMHTWPLRVRALIAAGEYFSALQAQEEIERGETLAQLAASTAGAQPGLDGCFSHAPPYPMTGI